MSASRTFHTADRFLAAFFLAKGIHWIKTEWRQTGQKPLLHFHFPRSHADVLEQRWFQSAEFRYSCSLEKVLDAIKQEGRDDADHR